MQYFSDKKSRLPENGHSTPAVNRHSQVFRNRNLKRLRRRRYCFRVNNCHQLEKRQTSVCCKSRGKTTYDREVMSLSELVLKTLIPSNFLDSDDDDMKSITDSDSGFNKNEFNVFNDYFGLINLVQKCKQNAIPSSEMGFFEVDEFSRFPRRDRFDSIDSENSSSGSCDSFTDLGLTIGDSSGFQPFPNASTFPSGGNAYRRRADSLTSLSRRGKSTTAAASNLPRGINTPSANLPQVCVFCRNNGEPEELYTSHVLKGPDGKTTCPILRAYTCPICKASGGDSHTIKYCPQNQQPTPGFVNGAQVTRVGPRPNRTVGHRKTR